MDPKFIHLCVRSDYSITSGLYTPRELVNKTYNLNMPAIGMVDYGNFYGAIKFYKSCYSMGIKPIFGVKFKLQSDLLNNQLSNINILAYNNVGYHNLIILISKAHQKKFQSIYSKNDIIICQSWLIQYKEGLIILSGGCKGDFGKYLIQGNYKIVNSFIDFYRKYFPQAYYLEVTRTNREYEEEYIYHAIKLSMCKNIPIVATNDVCFINKNDFSIHDIRVSIYQGIPVNSEKFFSHYSQEQFMKSEQEMCSLFSDIPEALENSVIIAKRCNVIIKTGKYFLPNFPTKKMNVRDFLVLKSVEGLKNRLETLYSNQEIETSVYKKYHNRLFYELDIINRMKFPEYFLVVMEFVQWAKSHNIPVGPGRGSGAGSLVAYVLKITELDPLAFDLLFERFLNPERISMPDFDIDFCMDKRDLVIEHVSQFYGRHHVAQIITFGKMSAKAVVRDVGRALGYPYGFINNISKLIPLDLGMTLKKSLSSKFELIHLYNKDIEVKNIIDISEKLEGVIKNIGKHAGGIVISPKSLIHFTPIQYDSHNMFITQFDKDDIDYVGLLKFDFLGLRTLTVIHEALKMINRFLVKKKQVHLNKISLYDQKSFQLLKQAQTTAVFQLESYGMKDLILKLQPDCFEDIISLIALFRPGPLQSGMVDNFINRKKGKEVIAYPDIRWQHKSLKPILKSTYGIILYQEQVMQIAQVLSGYTLSYSDILLRAMSKKNIHEMMKQRAYFQISAYKNGIPKKLSEKIFDLLEKFSGYGFNKSHSSAYALISYQTLWIKSNYPAQFMAAVMNSDIDNSDKIRISIRECFRMRLKIIAPNINDSNYFFTVNANNEIIYGLGAIRGIGRSVCDAIIIARKKLKSFSSLFDLCIYIDNKKINKRVLEKLIFSGALDVFKLSRFKLVNLIPQVLKLSNQYVHSRNINQLILFKPLLCDVEKFRDVNDIQDSLQFKHWSNKIQSEFEKDALGFYFITNPISEYIDELLYYTNGLKIKNISLDYKNKVVKIFGIISELRSKFTKRSNKVVFLDFIDGIDQIEVMVLNNVFSKYQDILNKGNILIITGLIIFNNINKVFRLIAYSILELDEARNKYVKRIILIVSTDLYNHRTLNKIDYILKPFNVGTIPLIMYYKNEHLKVYSKIDKSYNIIINEILISQLKRLLGMKNVYLKFD
ncbi:DNA polymerase III subunit alpha [Buchnera aphidicola]|uniref:DNA polymerase III subunit alpha n=1 Tax=Buchnera aphidicola (Stegophylla sp.) TaxID=2315800 RepID=A0A4D6YL23_9GAMM|nr:DNA polymerase III subunit alpha [Buchnera aphidicola (Stegophylla sp.)]QCI26338.1 DNA polymerase III subunit alpha [Buchnera aphidicola (Stegophylla sp.)]